MISEESITKITGFNFKSDKQQNREYQCKLKIQEINKNRISICKLLIEHGADVNAKNGVTTPLHEAARYGCIEICKLLIEHGADINTKNSQGKTPLDMAIKPITVNDKITTTDYNYWHSAYDEEKARQLEIQQRNQNKISICKLLIEHDADVNAKNEGTTLLHEVARYGYVEICKLLVERGTDINIKDKLGRTPLHEAATHDKLDVLKSLLEHGADVNAKNSQGETVLYTTIQKTAESSNILISNSYNSDVEKQKEKYRRELETQRSIWKLLIENGADVNAKDNSGNTPLHAASYIKYVDFSLYELLIQHGADVNAKNNSGDTPLHLVLRKSTDHNKSIDRFLIEHGADFNIKNNNGETPLDIAIKSYNQEIIDLCHHHSMMNANKQIQSDLAALLQKQNENANPKNEDKKEPAESNSNPKNEDKKESAKSNSNPKNEDKKESVQSNTITNLFNLLHNHYGFDVNAKDNLGQSLLHKAALSNDFDLCELLIKNGANVNDTDKSGRTLLTHATIIGNMKLCKFLVENGASVNAKNKYGETALHEAIGAGQFEICKLLVKHGADVNAKDSLNETPFDIANKINNKELIDLFRKHGAEH